MAAEGPKPQTSIPLLSDVIAGVGDARAITKDLKREAREAKREIKKAQKAGQKVAPELTRRLAQAENGLEKIKSIQTKQRTLQAGQTSTRLIGKTIRTLVPAQFIKDALSGQFDPASAAAFMFSVREEIDSLGERLFGKNSRGLRAVKQLGEAAPVLGQAVATVVGAINTIKADDISAQKFASGLSTGKITRDEFERFIGRRGSIFESGGRLKAIENLIGFAKDPKAVFDEEKIVAAAIREGVFKGRVLQDIIKKASVSSFIKSQFAKDPRGISGPDGIKNAKERGEEFGRGFLKKTRDAVAKRLSEESKKLGRTLRPKEIEIETRAAISAFFEAQKKGAGPDKRAAIQEIFDSIFRALKNRDNSKTTTPKTAFVEFQEREKKKMFEVNFQLRSSRRALTVPIGD